jgi:hypothetical protein
VRIERQLVGLVRISIVVATISMRPVAIFSPMPCRARTMPVMRRQSSIRPGRSAKIACVSGARHRLPRRPARCLVVAQVDEADAAEVAGDVGPAADGDRLSIMASVTRPQ